jgi:multisubunit Na+/H+ antiporter MnhF subunit
MTVSVFDGLLFGAELLFIPLALAIYIILSAPTVRRLVAMQLAGGIVALQLMLLSIAFATPSFADLSITLALLSIAGVFAYAHFLERWL